MSEQWNDDWEDLPPMHDYANDDERDEDHWHDDNQHEDDGYYGPEDEEERNLGHPGDPAEYGDS